MTRMFRRFFSSAICLLLVSFVLPGNEFVWNAERKLAWSDFKEKPPRNTPLIAMTYSTIFYEYSVYGGNINMKIVASFDEETSWTKDDTSRYLLNHEQIHFDITEIFARKFRKAVSESLFTKNNYVTKIRGLHEKTIGEWRKWQAQYDKDTDNSLIKSAQAEWNVKVAEELAALVAYDKHVLSIEFVK
jgi:hypothetical protein